MNALRIRSGSANPTWTDHFDRLQPAFEAEARRFSTETLDRSGWCLAGLGTKCTTKMSLCVQF